jgi:hypothetical protein
MKRFLFLSLLFISGSSFGTTRDYPTIAALEAVKPPTNGTIANTAGYWTPGDGGGAKYIYDSKSTEADNNGTIQAPKTIKGAGRWILIQNESLGLNPHQWGAKGDGQSPTFDTPALVNMFTEARRIMQANINGSPDRRYPKGVPINAGLGAYITTVPLPLFSGVKLNGSNGVANENGNLCSWTYQGAPGTTMFYYNEVDNTYNGADLDDITIQGIGFFGKQDMSVGFLPPFSKGGQSQIRNSTIQFNGFRYFKTIDLFLILVDLRNNYFNFMPQGCLKLGASDCDIISNKFGGGGYEYNGTRMQADSKFTRVVELQSFGNSRFDHNYISGDFKTPAPIPLYVENSFTSDFTANWYDYSDSGCIQLRFCNNLTFTGGILQGANRNSPLKNQYGGDGWGENECAVFIGNSNNIHFDKMIFREIPMKGDANFTPNQVTVRQWGTTNVHFTNIQTARLDPNNSSSSMYSFSYALENGSEKPASNNTFQLFGFEQILRVYTDNTAATSAGLPVGARYRTATGDIKVRY